MHSGLFLAGTCSSSRLRALVKLLSAALSSGLSVVSLVPSGCGACVCCEWEQGLETVFAAVRFGRGIPVPMDVLPSVPFGWLEPCARCVPAGGGSGRFAVPEEVGPFPARHTAPAGIIAVGRIRRFGLPCPVGRWRGILCGACSRPVLRAGRHVTEAGVPCRDDGRHFRCVTWQAGGSAEARLPAHQYGKHRTEQAGY